MNIIYNLADYIIHLDKYLNIIIQNCGSWTYLLLFAVIFCETGLVVTPFLPGDSLLFAVGAFSGAGALNVWWIYAALFAAAVLGDSVNYAIGKFFGHKIFELDKGRFLKKEYLDKTHSFFEKYGGKTIVLARFVPIVRTFAPFVAGIGSMSYLKFFTYNVVGAILWVTLLVFGGFYFGNMPIVKENFTAAIFVIIFVSILPGIVEFWKHKRKN